MEYDREICKVSDNQIVFPIGDYESIGDSLSSINYNFNALDVYTCNFEFSASNLWNTVYTMFNTNSASWVSVMNTVKSNSACWDNTFVTVKSLSAVWMKPISLVFPYVFSSEGDSNSIISEVTRWVNEALPIVSGACYNFIVGQELFIFTPQYKQINRILSQTKTTGVKTVKVKYAVNCIGAGTKSGYKNASIDCGSQRLDIAVPDQFVDSFVGLKFVVEATSSRWVYDSTLYN